MPVDSPARSLEGLAGLRLATSHPRATRESFERLGVAVELVTISGAVEVAPRLGLAWDPFGSGKTSVRAGFGLFFDEILPKYYFFSGSLNPPYTTRTSLRNPPFPNVVANFDPKTVKPQLQTVNFDLQTPYVIQYNLSVQRSLPGDVDVTIGYAGSRGKQGSPHSRQRVSTEPSERRRGRPTGGGRPAR